MAIYRNLITDADGDLLNITNGSMSVSDTASQTVLGTINTSTDNIEADAEAIRVLLDTAKDDLTGLIGVIEIEHHEIHEGEHFFIQNYISVGNAGVLNHTFLTGAKYAHMTFSINAADAGFILQTYEAATGDNDGTLITPLNNLRASLTASTVIVRENPGNTAIVGATALRASRNGVGGSVSTRVAGNLNRGNEVVLKPNTKYLVRITNLSTSANNINYDYSWYEES